MSDYIDNLFGKFISTYKYGGEIPSYESPRVDGWQIRLFWASARGYRWHVDLNKAMLAMGDKHYGTPKQALEDLLVSNDSDVRTAFKCILGGYPVEQTKGKDMAKERQQRVTQVTVLEKGTPIYGETATRIGIDDEGGGEYVTLSQNEGTVRINANEWPAIKEDVNKMFQNIEQWGVSKDDLDT